MPQQFIGWELSTVLSVTSIISGFYINTYVINHKVLNDNATGFETKEEFYKNMNEIPKQLLGRTVEHCSLSNSHPGALIIFLK